ncbi:MAG TPA: dynamin family protein [Candidatus Binatia bacterium]|jgi:tRNA U34 5-carboxymethylaminomethyl modifying GTPase MnmE/TrmE|nr:dynamin family protein [Candidatus Binatia bacterium]
MHDTTEAAPKLKPMAERSKNGRPAEELKDLLERVRKLCEELGEGFSDFCTRVAELQERLAEERFHLAVLGQFKRGKSTLLNALLGEPLLPTAVVPLTSIPTFLRGGKNRAVRVFFHDGTHADFFDLSVEQASDVLARHVTEKENPRNQLGVERVEVEHPSALLTAGVVLIDTPGIGSTFRHNTEATLSFLPQCDAAFFMVSADPPITEVEQEFLKSVRHTVAKLCFVMNKVDYLSESELADAMIFFDKALKEAGVRDREAIFRVSAKQGFEARVKENAALWRQSGLEKLQNYLLDFLSREKSQTLQLAIARKAVDVAADAAMNVELQRRSLELSQQELEKRIQVFNDKVKEIEHETVKMADLLAGDKKRAAQFLEELAESLRAEARRHLGEVIELLFKNNENPEAIERLARDQLTEEIPLFFGAKLASFCSEVNHALQEAIAPYYQRVEGLISALRSTAAELFDIPYRAPMGSGAFETRYRPYWVTQKWNTSISPVPEGFTDHFLPSELRKHRKQKRLAEEVEALVIRNVENIRWATLRNLDDACRRVSTTIDERLQETAEATRNAMRAAHLRQKQNENMAEPEINRLRQKATELAELENALAHHADS